MESGGEVGEGLEQWVLGRNTEWIGSVREEGRKSGDKGWKVMWNQIMEK